MTHITTHACMLVICYKVVSFDTEITSDSEEVVELARRTSDTEGHASPAVTSRIFEDDVEAIADFARIPARLWLGMYIVWCGISRWDKGTSGRELSCLPPSPSTLRRPCTCLE